MRENYLKNEYVEMWIEDGILFSIHSKKVAINLEIAKICVEDRLKVSEGRTMPILTDGRYVKAIDKAARDYLSNGDAIKGVSAGALIVRNEIQRLLGSVFISINEPPLPTKLFTNIDSAVVWLKNFRNIN